MIETTSFSGFSRDAIDFLAELAMNNERSWFQPRKLEYERLVKAPMEAFCAALGDRFRARSIPLEADPARSPFRIYRDVRFSRDKSPYKTHVSASFPWTGEGGGVGGYFHVQPGNMFVGGGMWHPDTHQLAAWRSLVDRSPEVVHDAIDDPRFVAEFGSVESERMKRPPKGFSPDHPEVALLKLKDITFGRHLSDDDVFSPALPDTVADALEAAVPVLRLLATLTPEQTSAAWLRRSR